MEDLVVLGWVESGPLYWHHLEHHSEEVARREPCEDIDAYNDHRCCLKHIDDWSLTVGSFPVGGLALLLVGRLGCWLPPYG